LLSTTGAGGARWSSEDLPEETVLLSGFLDKQNPNGVLGKKAWKRRFFILKSYGCHHMKPLTMTCCAAQWRFGDGGDGHRMCLLLGQIGLPPVMDNFGWMGQRADVL